MPNPPQAAFLEALGWTILNSWWQFGLLWLALLFLKKFLPAGSAAMRYTIALCLVFCGLGWMIVSFILRWNSLLDGGYQFVPIAHNHIADWYSLINGFLQASLPYISIVYLLWLAVNLLTFAKSVFVSQDLKHSGLDKAPANWRIFVQDMAIHMNIRPIIQLWVSHKIDTPMIIGWLKPVILIPAAAISQLQPDQLEAILIHELAHIRRNDYFWNMLVAVAELVLFYNPFAKWIINEIRHEREHSCDDWVLQFPYQPEQYAHALLQLEHQRINQKSQLILAANGNNNNSLLVRVQRMLKVPVTQKVQQGRLTAMMLIVLLLCLVAFFEPRQEISQLLAKTISFPAMNTESPQPEILSHQTNFTRKTVKSKVSKTVQANSSQQFLPQSASEGPAAITNKAIKLLSVSEDANRVTADMAFPAYLTEEPSYSLLDNQSPLQTNEPSFSGNLPYIPRSSFQAISQRDSLIPEAILLEKMAEMQDKEVTLQTTLAQVQQRLEKMVQEKIAGIDLSEQLLLKKSELENLKNLAEKQTKEYSQILEKQAKMRQEQFQKTTRKRKTVHI